MRFIGALFVLFMLAVAFGWLAERERLTHERATPQEVAQAAYMHRHPEGTRR
jgi:hypothetical protein